MNEAIAAGKPRFVWWDGTLWWRTYHEGGFDGYRTLFPPMRRLPSGTMETAVRRPGLADEIRRLSQQPRRG